MNAEVKMRSADTGNTGETFHCSIRLLCVDILVTFVPLPTLKHVLSMILSQIFHSQKGVGRRAVRRHCQLLILMNAVCSMVGGIALRYDSAS